MGDAQPSTSGRGTSNGGLHLPMLGYQQPPSTAKLALTIAGAAVAGAVIWHFTRETYYSYVPPKVLPGAGLSAACSEPRGDTGQAGCAPLPPQPAPCRLLAS